MNPIDNRKLENTMKLFATCAASVLISAGLVLSGGGAAFAATPGHASSPATVQPSTHSGVGHFWDTTQGYNVYNYTNYSFNYVSSSGQTPAGPSTISSNKVGNFELCTFAGGTTGAENYSIISNGTIIGYLRLSMNYNPESSNGYGEYTATLTDLTGQPLQTVTANAPYLAGGQVNMVISTV